MTARRDSVDEPEAGSSAGRALLIGTVVFAAAATGLLVLADDMRWLRLGIVAALWAALVGAFLAAKYRRQLADKEDALADRQELYELELEREIAARREYELEALAEAKRVAEEESRDDLAALRGELQSLRTTLESLLGGEFLVERYALRAESTRMRSLPDDRQLKRLPAAMAKDEIPSVVREAETELIERVREVHQPPRREPPRAEPRPAAVSQPLPKPQQRPVPEPVKRAEPVAQARRVEPPPHPAEVSDRWFIPGALDENGVPRRRPAAPQPAYDKWEPELSEIEEEWTPSWEAANQSRRHEQPEPARPEPAQPGGHARPDNGRYAVPADSGRRAGQGPVDSDRYAVPPVAASNGRVAQPADQGRRARQDPVDSGQYVVPPAAADLGRRARPAAADSGQFAVPPAADVGRRGRQDPADSSQFAGHPAAADLGRRARQDAVDSGQYVAPPAATDLGRRARLDAADSGQYVAPAAAADLGRRARLDAADSGQFVVSPAADVGRWGRQNPADSGQYVVPAVAADVGRRARPGVADSGQDVVPPAAAELGRRGRQDPADSSQFAGSPAAADVGRRARQDVADSGQFAVPPPADLGRRGRPDPIDSGQYVVSPAADLGRRARQDPAESGQFAVPPAAADVGRRARQDPADASRYATAADSGRRRQDPADSSRYAGHQETEVAMRPVEPPAPTHDTSKPVGHQSEQTSWLAQYNQPKPPSPDRDPLDYRARPYRTHAADSGQFPVVDDLPPSGRRHARTEPEGDSGGGRRRRAEGQPTWQEAQSGNRNGHSRPEPVEEPSGSHAAGRSVNELLANHGLEAGPRRRRRRED